MHFSNNAINITSRRQNFLKLQLQPPPPLVWKEIPISSHLFCSLPNNKRHPSDDKIQTWRDFVLYSCILFTTILRPYCLVSETDHKKQNTRVGHSPTLDSTNSFSTETNTNTKYKLKDVRYKIQIQMWNTKYVAHHPLSPHSLSLRRLRSWQPPPFVASSVQHICQASAKIKQV